MVAETLFPPLATLLSDDLLSELIDGLSWLQECWDRIFTSGHVGTVITQKICRIEV